jgi:ubiquinone/menaquinone biosynthesis C-methylase UbiE
MERERLYKDLAWLWPTMSPPEDYIEEAEFLTGLIRNHLDYEPKSMLHLGCGGGHMDMTFKKHFTITGIDKSTAMLDLARRLNPECEYILGDMTDLDLRRSFDIALIYDSVNYMLSEAQLTAVFETAFRHLKPGGLALTVVEQTPHSFRQNNTKVQHRQKGGIELTYIEHWYDPDPSDTTYETIYIYLIRKDGHLSIEHDLHACGIFPLDTWERLLRTVGFESDKETFKHSTFSPGEEYPILLGRKKVNA